MPKPFGCRGNEGGNPGEQRTHTKKPAVAGFFPGQRSQAGCLA